MPHDAPSTFCEVCTLFGADYTQEFRAWLESDNDKYRFFIPFRRIDVLPDLPGLTKSAQLGCELCEIIRSHIQAQHNVFVETDRQAALRNGARAEEDLDLCTHNLAVSRDHVELAGGFEFVGAAIPTDELPPAFSIFVETKYHLKNRNGPLLMSLDFEVLGTVTGHGATNPPVILAARNDALHPDNLLLVHKWLDDCEGNHEDCKPYFRKMFLPTRLLYVGSGNSALMETKALTDMQRATIRYIALSYCWGPPTKFDYKTTAANHERRLRSFAVEDLPQTVKDAITVARALEVDYLWIDSICIVQDVPKDLEAEMELMLEVYANAYVTISATGAASAHEGFLDRVQRKGPRLFISRRSHAKEYSDDNFMTIYTQERWGAPTMHGIWETAVGRSPWNKRAWTLQEALTSPRVIHFGRERLLFECATIDCFEGGDISRPKNTETSNYHATDQVYRSVSFLRRQGALSYTDNGTHPGKIEQVYKDYYSVVRKYSARDLTFITDKAAAFSSIVIAMTRITGSLARNGLLLEDLRRGLLWFGTGEKKRLKQWPSWSWLSHDGIITHFPEAASSLAEEQAMAHVLLGEHSPQTTEIADSYQPPCDYSLCLHAFLIQATLTQRRMSPRFDVHFENKSVGEASFDDKSDISGSMAVYLLSLGESDSEKYKAKLFSHNSYAFMGLVLLSCNRSLYRRIGTFQLYDGKSFPEDSKDSRWIFSAAPRSQVTIV